MTPPADRPAARTSATSPPPCAPRCRWRRTTTSAGVTPRRKARASTAATRSARVGAHASQIVGSAPGGGHRCAADELDLVLVDALAAHADAGPSVVALGEHVPGESAPLARLGTGPATSTGGRAAGRSPPVGGRRRPGKTSAGPRSRPGQRRRHGRIPERPLVECGGVRKTRQRNDEPRPRFPNSLSPVIAVAGVGRAIASRVSDRGAGSARRRRSPTVDARRRRSPRHGRTRAWPAVADATTHDGPAPRVGRRRAAVLRRGRCPTATSSPRSRGSASRRPRPRRSARSGSRWSAWPRRR